MKTFLLSAALTILVAPAFAETTWSGTGSRGGTIQGSGSCARGDGALTCNRAATWTGPQGQTATRTGARVSTTSGTTKTFVASGPNGRSATTTRTRNR